MVSGLPINIQDLLHFRGVEQARVELKKSWNRGPTSAQIARTLCAFANDFQNINGGYLIIGVEDEDGKAKLPPAGLDPAQLEDIQRAIRVLCKTRIDPEYQPLISPSSWMVVISSCCGHPVAIIVHTARPRPLIKKPSGFITYASERRPARPEASSSRRSCR